MECRWRRQSQRSNHSYHSIIIAGRLENPKNVSFPLTVKSALCHKYFMRILLCVCDLFTLILSLLHSFYGVCWDKQSISIKYSGATGLPVCVLTNAIHSTRYSSIKLLKYWFRNRSPGPMKAKSWRCISLFVICATWGGTQQSVSQSASSGLNRTNFHSSSSEVIYVWRCHWKCNICIVLYKCPLCRNVLDLQLICWWFWPTRSQTPGYKDTGVSRTAGQQTFYISSLPKW